ncbi:MAG: DUF1579 domain-containing protein [Verrucomicrobia bacterium]|nr:DUF1579 domain-containing protein [Verrucomicrobiota bacterium]
MKSISLRGTNIPHLFRALALIGALALATPALVAQEPPRPGPEHQKLKELEGTWDALVKMGSDESKGVVTYKMDLGGLWLVSDFVGEFGGMKFVGKGLNGYDPVKKKHVGVWVDCFSTSPMIAEGTFDKEGKVITMTGEGPGPDGKPAKFRMTTEYKDQDSHVWTMFATGPDGADGPMMSITYKRRK